MTAAPMPNTSVAPLPEEIGFDSTITTTPEKPMNSPSARSRRIFSARAMRAINTA